MARISKQDLTLTFNVESKIIGTDSLGPITVMYPKQTSGVTSLQIMEIVFPLIQNLGIEVLRRGEKYYNLNKAVEKAKNDGVWDGMFTFDNLFILYIESARVNFRKVIIHERVPNIAGDWECWLHALWGLERFTQAYICDADYSYWQNVEDITRFKNCNKDYSKYTVIANNYPPPFRGDMIDVTKNPGRIIEHDRWIEAVASPMWFGDEFWKLMKPGKKEEIMESDLVKCKELQGGILEVRALECCIDETVSESFQNKLRCLFFGK